MRWSMIVLVLIVLGGCKKEKASAPDDAPALSERPAEAPAMPETPLAPGIKLREPGEEPHRALRSVVAAERKQTLALRVDNQVDAVIGALQATQAPRSIVFDLTLQTDGKLSDAGYDVSFTVDKARTVDDAAVPADAQEARRAALAAIRGLEGSYRLDALAMVREVALKLPSNPSGELSGVAGDLEWALRQLGAPFPAEPVGRGATWTVSRGLVQDGVAANEVSTFEITELKGQLVTIETNVQQSADLQTFRNPGSAVEVDLTDFVGQGSGEITWNPRKRIPRAANVTSTVTKHLTFESEGTPTNSMITIRRTLTIDGPGS